MTQFLKSPKVGGVVRLILGIAYLSLLFVLYKTQQEEITVDLIVYQFSLAMWICGAVVEALAWIGVRAATNDAWAVGAIAIAVALVVLFGIYTVGLIPLYLGIALLLIGVAFALL